MSKNEGAVMVTIEQVKQFLAKHFAFKVLDKRITPTLYGWLVSLVPDEYYTSSTYRPTIPGEGGLQIDRETGVYYRLPGTMAALERMNEQCKKLGIKSIDDIQSPEHLRQFVDGFLTAQGNITDNTTGAVNE